MHMTAYIWLAIILLAVVVLSLSVVTVTVELTQHGATVQGSVRIRALFGLLKVRRELKELHPKLTKEGPAVKSVHQAVTKQHQESTLTSSEVWGFVKNWRSYASVLPKAWHPLKRFLRSVQVSEVKVNAVVGTGDVVSTGCLVGAAWGGVGMIIGQVSRLTRFTAKPQLSITPNFQGTLFDAAVHCIARVTLGHAIVGVLRMSLTWVSIQKTLQRLTSRPRKEEKTWNTPSRG